MELMCIICIDLFYQKNSNKRLTINFKFLQSVIKTTKLLACSRPNYENNKTLQEFNTVRSSNQGVASIQAHNE